MLFYRKLLDFPFRQRHTTIGQWTKQAGGSLRSTLYRPEIHNSLIINSRLSLIQQFISQRSKQLFPFRRVYSSLNPKITRQYPIYITINHRIRHIISKGTNGSCRILSYPLQAQYSRICFRKYPIHTTGSSVKITCTGIISQSLPELHHLIFISFGKCPHIREAFNKTHKIIIPLYNPCLLQNDFRNPYQVRIGRLPPG